HGAVANHQHAVEELLALGIVQVREEVRHPGDGVGLARAGGVLNQVPLAGAVLEDIGHQRAGGGELMVAREDNGLGLLLLVALADQVAVKDVEPAVARPDLLPQVGGGEPVRVRRIARAASVSAVEGQKGSRRTQQPRGHLHFALADSEVHQGAARETQHPSVPGLKRRVTPAAGGSLAASASSTLPSRSLNATAPFASETCAASFSVAS